MWLVCVYVGMVGGGGVGGCAFHECFTVQSQIHTLMRVGCEECNKTVLCCRTAHTSDNVRNCVEQSPVYLFLLYIAVLSVIPYCQRALEKLMVTNIECKARYSNPITGLDRPLGFQEVEASRFLDNRHMKVVRLSALRTDRLYPPGNIPDTDLC
jgi:hypothetical protein